MNIKKRIIMRKFLKTLLVFCIFINGFAQVKKKDQEVDIINHEVQLGESVRLLSKKYLVDPSEIYKLNKFAVDGISQGMILKIPVPRKEGAIVRETEHIEKSEPISNETKPIESKPIEKVVSVEESVDENKTQTPNNDIKQIVITENKREVNHKVIAKETLYSLSRDYNVSVDDIKSSNPEVSKNGLKIGQIVKILTNKETNIQQSTSITNAPPVKEKPSDEIKTEPKSTTSSAMIKHKVEPKETLYSLSKKYNVTVEDIKKQNEKLLINGLQIGQVLEINPNN
jgi:LysM repeat protein